MASTTTLRIRTPLRCSVSPRMATQSCPARFSSTPVAAVPFSPAAYNMTNDGRTLFPSGSSQAPACDYTSEPYAPVSPNYRDTSPAYDDTSVFDTSMSLPYGATEGSPRYNGD